MCHVSISFCVALSVYIHIAVTGICLTGSDLCVCDIYIYIYIYMYKVTMYGYGKFHFVCKTVYIWQVPFYVQDYNVHIYSSHVR